MQINEKGAPPSPGMMGDRSDLAAPERDHGVDDGKPQTHALVLLLGREKGIENTFAAFGQPRTAVSHFQANLLSGFVKGSHEQYAGFGFADRLRDAVVKGMDGVGQEIDNDLLQLHSVAAHSRERVRKLLITLMLR